jgi:hypothetical protein
MDEKENTKSRKELLELLKIPFVEEQIKMAEDILIMMIVIIFNLLLKREVVKR